MWALTAPHRKKRVDAPELPDILRDPKPREDDEEEHTNVGIPPWLGNLMSE